MLDHINNFQQQLLFQFQSSHYNRIYKLSLDVIWNLENILTLSKHERLQKASIS